MRDFGLKMLSLLIGTLLCVYVNSDNNVSSARIQVSVEVRDVPQDKIIVWQSRKFVEVEIRGPSFLVSRVASSPPTLRINLPESVGSRFTAQINRSDIDIDAPLQVVSIEPSSIPFSIENRLTRELPVKVIRTGSISSAFRLEELMVTPENVTVTGPESEVRDLSHIATAPFDLSELKESGSSELVLRIPGGQTELSRSSVKARYRVEVVNMKRVFDALPIEARLSQGDTVKLDPAQVTVTVHGTKEKIEALASEEVIPFIRLGAVQQRKREAEVSVEVPPGVVVDSVTPKTVRILAKGR